MAISITITDGTETVTLTATDALLESYTPVTPGVDDASVTETLAVSLIGGNAAQAATIAKLERLFRGARERINGAYGIAYVYMKVTLDSAVWRSPVQDGRVVTADEGWIKGEWALGIRRTSVIVQREAWWEADSEVQIPLSNSNGTDNTAGLNVYNCDDESGSSPNKRQNWMNAKAADVVGDLPAPVRMELKNKHATAEIYDLMIAENIFSDPDNLITWYEGDIIGGATHADATMSGGSYQDLAGTAILVSKDITSMAAKLQPGYYRLLVRQNALGTWKFRPFSLNGASQAIGKTITTIVATSPMWWWDLGIVQIPPLYIPGKTYAAITIGWTALIALSATYYLDCFQLTPIDGWKRIVMADTLAQNETLHLNEILGQVYGTNSSGYIKANGSVMGEALMVYPNKLHRFYFVWNSSATSSDITGYFETKMYYRPRRRTL